MAGGVSSDDSAATCGPLSHTATRSDTMATRALSACLLLLGLTAPAAMAQAPATSAGDMRQANIRAYVDLLRSDVRAQKVAIITELMAFTEAEDKAFWPIYREYDADLTTLNDEKLKGIQEFASNYETLTDAMADSLATRALDLETRRTALRQKYHARIKSELSPRIAARFLQIEHQIQLLIDLQIAAALPIIQ
jgi:hypothetical protein